MIMKKRRLFGVTNTPRMPRYFGTDYAAKSVPKTAGRVGGGTLKAPTGKKRGRPRKKVDDFLLKDKNRDFDYYAPKLNATNARKPMNTTDGYYMPIDPFVTPGLTQNPRDIPMKVEEGSRTIVKVSDAVVPRGVIRTLVETGHPTTKALKKVAKENGTTTMILYDTKVVDSGANREIEQLIPRGELDSGHGFNHKTLRFLHGAASPGFRAMFDGIFGKDNMAEAMVWATRDTSFRFKDKRYASFMWLESKVSIFNESAYLPTKVKFHLIKPLNKLSKDDATNTESSKRNHLYDIADNVFNAQSVGTLSQSKFAIPNMYQYSVPLVFGNDQIPGIASTDNYKRVGMVVFLDNKATLTSSAYFRENFKIEKTVTKTLQPSDTWIFTHRQHFGSGIDVDAFRAGWCDMQFSLPSLATNNLNFIGNDVPIGYIYAVEHVGVPVTCVVGDSNVAGVVTPSTYQGTSDGQIHMEYRSKLKFINSSQNNIIQIGADGSDQFVHMRTFTNQDFSYNVTERPRHVFPDNMVDTLSGVTADKGYIPLVTDRVITSNLERGLQSGNT